MSPFVAPYHTNTHKYTNTAKKSMLGLILSCYPYLRSVMVRFPLSCSYDKFCKKNIGSNVNFIFFKPFKKYARHTFSTHQIFEHMPPFAINGNQKRTLDPIHFLEKLVIKTKQLYIFDLFLIFPKFNYDHHSPFSKKVHF